MQVVVTGVAGFIGYHASKALLDNGAAVIGIDNLNGYYDPVLKQARLDQLQDKPGFTFLRGDIADPVLYDALRFRYPDVTHVLHLAAQPGVIHSQRDPQAYIHSNVDGQRCVLEYAATLPKLRHMVYASSSSAYGDQCTLPLREDADSGAPLSFYGITKRAGELMGEYYHKLGGLSLTGLRLFTSYGPFGRPDMAYYRFTKSLYSGETITLNGNGEMLRDFTYIDDTVAGILSALRQEPERHHIINIGSNHTASVAELLALLEQVTGRKAKTAFAERPMLELPATCADISLAQALLGYEPRTRLNEGIPHFVAWFCGYHGVS